MTLEKKKIKTMRKKTGTYIDQFSISCSVTITNIQYYLGLILHSNNSQIYKKILVLNKKKNIQKCNKKKMILIDRSFSFKHNY